MWNQRCSLVKPGQFTIKAQLGSYQMTKLFALMFFVRGIMKVAWDGVGRGHDKRVERYFWNKLTEYTRNYREWSVFDCAHTLWMIACGLYGITLLYHLLQCTCRRCFTHAKLYKQYLHIYHKLWPEQCTSCRYTVLATIPDIHENTPTTSIRTSLPCHFAW